MKLEIIPTILVKTFKEVEERIKAVEDYVDWVQLDIMDGVFVNNTTWNNPSDLKNFKTKIKILPKKSSMAIATMEILTGVFVSCRAQEALVKG